MHEKLMRRALALARRGVGRASPNPLVGAVVVKDGQTIGEGYHVYEKRDHAETLALLKAGPRAAGASLYVNLEPCCHQGRTSPCVDRIVEAGISDVFVGTGDPNPLVGGKGLQKLREQGIRVQEGLCRQEASRLNEKFFHFMGTGYPFVLLKLALTLDGKIATRTGESQWITGEAARGEAQRLRYEYDAVLVGINTILNDNPLLTVRWKRTKPTTRIILDSLLRTPPTARIFEAPDRVVILHAFQAPEARARQLATKATLFAVPEQNGLLCWEAILRRLAELPVTGVVIEGGGRVAASALRAGIVQKVNFFYAPKIIGGDGAPAIEPLNVNRLEDALNLREIQLRQIGNDYLVEGYLGTLPPL